MTPTSQLILVGLAVAVAAFYIVHATWKTWAGKSVKGCGAGCGTCTATAPDAKQKGRFPLPQV